MNTKKITSIILVIFLLVSSNITVNSKAASKNIYSYYTMNKVIDSGTVYINQSDKKTNVNYRYQINDSFTDNDYKKATEAIENDLL